MIDKVKQWTNTTFDDLETVIAAFFHVNGLYPKQNNQGLWVDIPSSNSR
jgi:hypothetical protein